MDKSKGEDKEISKHKENNLTEEKDNEKIMRDEVDKG